MLVRVGVGLMRLVKLAVFVTDPVAFIVVVVAVVAVLVEAVAEAFF